MTKRIEDYDDRAWDRFFDFLAEGVSDMSADEVDAELTAAGIDTSDAIERVRERLERSERDG